MAFDKRIEELIALGAAVAANCHPCLQYHVSKALEVGISEQEINDAIEVGKTIRRGATNAMDKFAGDLSRKMTASEFGSSENCNCGCR